MKMGSSFVSGIKAGENFSEIEMGSACHLIESCDWKTETDAFCANLNEERTNERVEERHC